MHTTLSLATYRSMKSNKYKIDLYSSTFKIRHFSYLRIVASFLRLTIVISFQRIIGNEQSTIVCKSSKYFYIPQFFTTKYSHHSSKNCNSFGVPPFFLRTKLDEGSLFVRYYSGGSSSLVPWQSGVITDLQRYCNGLILYFFC